MASIRERPRKGFTSYEVRWRDESRALRSRALRTRDAAERLANELGGLNLKPWGTAARTPRTPAERIKESVKIDARGCWVWQLYTHPTEGYGSMQMPGQRRLAHRVSYETFVGPIPEGLCIDHLCRNRACVNPEHLEPVTNRENTLRSPIAQAAIHARQTHCIHGHKFTADNTYVTPKGHRGCRTCMRESNRRAQRRRRLAKRGGS